MKIIGLDHKRILNIGPRVFDENWANIITADALSLESPVNQNTQHIMYMFIIYVPSFRI